MRGNTRLMKPVSPGHDSLLILLKGVLYLMKSNMRARRLWTLSRTNRTCEIIISKTILL